MTPADLPPRFASKIRVDGECWIFTGAVQSSGYGCIAVDGNGTTRLAHRAAYELLVRPIPDGLTIDHLCMIKRCVNPAHLEAVPLAENVRRAHRSGLQYSLTHCAQGHQRTPDVWRTKQDGRHYCAECHRARQRQAVAS